MSLFMGLYPETDTFSSSSQRSVVLTTALIEIEDTKTLRVFE